MTVYCTVCAFCEHYLDGFKCKAFPEGIPNIMLDGRRTTMKYESIKLENMYLIGLKEHWKKVYVLHGESARSASITLGITSAGHIRAVCHWKCMIRSIGRFGPIRWASIRLSGGGKKVIELVVDSMPRCGPMDLVRF